MLLLIKIWYRNNFGEEALSHSMRMVMDRKPYADHDSTKAIVVFFKQKSRKKGFTEQRKRPVDPNSSGSKCPSKVKKQKLVQKNIILSG